MGIEIRNEFLGVIPLSKWVGTKGGQIVMGGDSIKDASFDVLAKKKEVLNFVRVENGSVTLSVHRRMDDGKYCSQAITFMIDELEDLNRRIGKGIIQTRFRNNPPRVKRI